MFAIDRTKRVLGLALGERGLSLAEVILDPAPGHVARSLDFTFPTGVGLEQGATLGAALADVLKQHEVTTRHVVVGVPARWLVLKSHEIPPTDRDTVSDILWLQATANVRPELGEMVFDYAGHVSDQQPSTVLLMGLQRQWMDRVRSLAEAAGLRLLAVTPTAGALAAAGRADATCVLSLRKEAAELVTRDADGVTRSMRHVGPTAPTDPLMSQLRRASELPAADSGRGVLLWDEVGLDSAVLETLHKAAGTRVDRGELHSMGVNSNGAIAPAPSAVALALIVARGRRAEVDFLHPSIAPPRPEHPAWRNAAIAAGVIVALVLGALATYDAVTLRRQLASADEELAALEPSLKVARPMVASMSAVESFQTGNPRYLACLRDLTVALPADGQTSFTSFKLDSNMKGEISGRSTSDYGPLALVAALASGKRFADLSPKLDAHSAQGTGGGVGAPAGRGGAQPNGNVAPSGPGGPNAAPMPNGGPPSSGGPPPQPDGAAAAVAIATPGSPGAGGPPAGGPNPAAAPAMGGPNPAMPPDAGGPPTPPAPSGRSAGGPGSGGGGAPPTVSEVTFRLTFTYLPLR